MQNPVAQEFIYKQNFPTIQSRRGMLHEGRLQSLPHNIQLAVHILQFAVVPLLILALCAIVDGSLHLFYLNVKMFNL